MLTLADLHPDPHFKYHSSVAEEEACHRGRGPAGYYGAETTSCDSPFSLINETFRWLDENIKDSVDFVLWTGDSARHDNDELLPRNDAEIKELNEYCVNMFLQVFGDKGILTTPVVPTWGNNDVLPHNIFYPGPNRWTRAFLDIWQPFIPESQRHGFEYGGWFWTEVIPDRLAVLSINSMYFAENNAAVDGCADRTEPGYAQFEWLRIQLALLRKRGMKAIIMGHQAPARTESKSSWDETCWQKYTLWLHQYRDIVVGTVWGHMNIDHFILQDFRDVTIDSISGRTLGDRAAMDDKLTTQGLTDYLTELRELWHDLPSAPKNLGTASKKKKDKFYKEIGGHYGERYSLSLVSPSLVPNYYPTLRIVEYNISGLDSNSAQEKDLGDTPSPYLNSAISEKSFKIPNSPSKSAPPGPAYSPQTFTWLKYAQYYANLTISNNDFTTSGWKEGKHKNEEPASNPQPNPKKLTFEVEYDTADDKVYSMKDLTILSHLKLAETIGQYKSKTGVPEELDGNKRGKKKKKKKHKKKGKRKKHINRVWHAFVRRAFVGAIDDAQLEDQFGGLSLFEE